MILANEMAKRLCPNHVPWLLLWNSTVYCPKALARREKKRGIWVLLGQQCQDRVCGPNIERQYSSWSQESRQPRFHPHSRSISCSRTRGRWEHSINLFPSHFSLKFQQRTTLIYWGNLIQDQIGLVWANWKEEFLPLVSHCVIFRMLPPPRFHNWPIKIYLLSHRTVFQAVISGRG